MANERSSENSQITVGDSRYRLATRIQKAQLRFDHVELDKEGSKVLAQGTR